jgi:hypothetical protein
MTQSNHNREKFQYQLTEEGTIKTQVDALVSLALGEAVIDEDYIIRRSKDFTNYSIWTKGDLIVDTKRGEVDISRRGAVGKIVA